jgi:hypothetical protein
MVYFEIFRDGTSPNDTMPQDAYFLYALIQYGVNKYSG